MSERCVLRLRDGGAVRCGAAQTAPLVIIIITAAGADSPRAVKAGADGRDDDDDDDDDGAEPPVSCTGAGSSITGYLPPVMRTTLPWMEEVGLE